MSCSLTYVIFFWVVISPAVFLCPWAMAAKLPPSDFSEDLSRVGLAKLDCINMEILYIFRENYYVLYIV